MWPFKSKNSAVAKNNSVQKVGSRMVRIPSLDFFGSYAESPNGHFLIAWSDSDSSRGVGGYRDKGHGSYVLVNDGIAVCSGELERPNDGKVTDDGVFVLADWMFGDSLKSIIYAFSPNGAEIMHHRFSANMFNTGLSPTGHYAVAQLANSDSNDGGCLAFLDLVERKLLWKQLPVPGLADSYCFNDGTKRLGLAYRDRGIYEYTYDGIFVDSDRWGKDRIKYASGFELVWIAQDRLKQYSNTRITPEDADDILKILNLALTKDLDKYPNEQANAYRAIGEIYDALGNLSLAIDKYEAAIRLNPKVGVKRRLDKLKEQSHKAG